MGVFMAIGECMIELAALENGLMKKGFAGDTFNTAWYAHLYLPADWRTEYFTTLGDDAASADMLAFFKNSGIGATHVRQLAGKSPGLYMIHLKDGERSFSYWRDSAAARSLAGDEAALKSAMDSANIVYFSGITLAILPENGRERLLRLAADARAAGHLVAFDPNLRPRLWTSLDDMRHWVMKAAAVSDIALPGFDDEATYFGDPSITETIARYREAGTETVIVKDGPNGATLSTKTGRTHIPAANAAAIIDTTAAGDSFNGAFFAKLAAGKAMEEALGFAAEVAARVIGHRGALIDRNTLGL
jgi:2-dehydro-3-deoxygluconokinase